MAIPYKRPKKYTRKTLNAKGIMLNHGIGFLKNGKQYQIDMHLKHNRSKGIAVNKIPMKKASELFGILNIVFFSPEDLNIIKNGPSERRHFLDAELCQLDKIYLYDLSNYNKILNQRNKLLKDMVYRPELSDTLPFI